MPQGSVRPGGVIISIRKYYIILNAVLLAYAMWWDVELFTNFYVIAG